MDMMMKTKNWKTFPLKNVGSFIWKGLKCTYYIVSSQNKITHTRQCFKVTKNEIFNFGEEGETITHEKNN